MFFKFAGSTSTRGHPLKLLYPDARINALAHAFPVRIVSLWNRLPANIVLPANLKQFKMYGALESVYVLRRHRSCRDYYYYYY